MKRHHASWAAPKVSTTGPSFAKAGKALALASSQLGMERETRNSSGKETTHSSAQSSQVVGDLGGWLPRKTGAD